MIVVHNIEGCLEKDCSVDTVVIDSEAGLMKRDELKIPV